MNSTASETGTTRPIVLIHGMWMTPRSWEHWADRYRGRGHQVLTPAWPGLEGEPEAIRRDPSPLRGLSIPDVIDHYEKIIGELDQPPIIIGHSFGGLYAQLLADRGLGVAVTALSTGAPKGVLKLPLSTLRAAWPALHNPFGKDNVVPLTQEQFHWCFTNSLSRADSDAVYERYYIPGSARPFFQAGYANFNPRAPTKVDYKNPNRPPLLLVTGTEDRICPPSVNESNFEKQRRAPTATEHKEYPGRCHFPGQDGWEEVADFILAWTTDHATEATPRPAL
jgi:pimeloyl-ACP methyl ester carboxylesterase